MGEKCIPLHAAKAAKNDEFYTRLCDIEDEVQHYAKAFCGKTVLCNCDDPSRSNFWKYFHEHFAELGLRKLTATYYAKDTPVYLTEYEGGNDADVRIGTRTLLNGDGDFRSTECIDALQACDIVVTNCPFSLFQEFVALLLKYEKKFLIIGAVNAIPCKNFFPFIRDDRVWLGYGSPKAFITPFGEQKRFGNTLWFTNLDHHKRQTPLRLSARYDPARYPKYDNYDAIDVAHVADIPCDYDGVMGVPVSFLTKYCPEQFTVLGYTSGRQETDPAASPTKRYRGALQHAPDGTVVNGSKLNTRAVLAVEDPHGVYYTAENSDRKLAILYIRVLIRLKNPLKNLHSTS